MENNPLMFKILLITLLTMLSTPAFAAAPSQIVLKNQFGEVSVDWLSYTSETIAAAGALSPSIGVSLVNNATSGSYAVTLAAPASQDGQIKIVKLGTATHTVTLAMTNIKVSGAYTPTGTTTLTFTAVGDSAIFMAVGAKWVYIGGSAVAS
jgi:hypothetical protein